MFRRHSHSEFEKSLATDSMTANVMVADASLTIVYMNRSVTELLTEAQADIRKDLPRFSVATLIGSNIDVFHKHPEHQRRILENLNATHGLVFSGQLLLALTQSGVSRETAYEWVQRNAMKVWDEGGDFQTLINADPDIQKHLSPEQIKNAFSLDTYLRNVDSVFERVFNKSLEQSS